MKLRNILSATLLAAAALTASAADCEIGIGLAPLMTEGDAVPAGIQRKLQAKLKGLLAHTVLLPATTIASFSSPDASMRSIAMKPAALAVGCW